MNNNPNEKFAASQCQQIKEALLRGERLTQKDVYERFGCWRLSGRIHDLRFKHDLPVTMEKITLPSGKIVGQYFIEREVLDAIS